MNKFFRNLLALTVSLNCVALVTPCVAEVVKEGENISNENSTSLSLDTISTNNQNQKESADKKTVLSSALNKKPETTAKSSSRVPIFSRIFPVSSMRQ